MRIRCTFVFFVLLICYAPIFDVLCPKTNFGPGIPDFGPVRVLSYLALLSFFTETSIKRIRIKWNKWLTIILFFSLIVIFSVSWSHNYTYNTSTLQVMFASIILPLLVAFMSVNLFYDKRMIIRFIKHISIGGAGLAIVSIFQFMFKLSVVHGEVRSAATLGNPNALAIFLVLIIPCFLYAVEKKLFKRPLGEILLLIVFIGILCTVSRKGIVTSILAFVLYSLFKKNWKLLLIAVIISIFCVFVIVRNKTMNERFNRTKLTHDVQGKWAMAQAGIKMFRNHPILGLGFKGYYENFGKYFPLAYRRKYDAHNEYVTALANYGMLGFFPFICIFLYPTFVAVRNLQKTQFKRDMGILGISIIIPFMINIAFAGTAFYQQVLTSLFYAHTSFIFVDENEE